MGSSSTRSLASSDIALTISTICCCAVDSWRTSVLGPKWVTPTSSRSSRVRRSMARMSTRPRLVGSRLTNTFSATVRSGRRLNSWKMIATPAACAWTGCENETCSPSSSIVPPSGEYTPARTFIKVDLPAPFSPMTAWISPASHSRPTPWSTSTPRKLFRMSFIANSGAIALWDLHPFAGRRRGEHGIDQVRAARAVRERREPQRRPPPRMAAYESATKRSKQSR